MTELAEDDCWTAVTTRDAAADGRFVFAVRTTGIYCRPGCPARTPLRRHVAFHPSAAAAEAAGYRACKRCRPDDASADVAQAVAVARAAAWVDAALAAGDKPPTLAALAAAAGYGKHHFHRMFKAVLGVAPGAYVAHRRADQTQAALETPCRIVDAVYAGGYGASSRFYAQAPATLGMAPSVWRDGGAGERIRWAIVETTLGPLLVAATVRGLCAVRFGDDAPMLERWLVERFQRAVLIADDAGFDALIAAVVARIERPRAAADPLPLDIRGTAFQRQVWAALNAIPPGETRSYVQIAAAIGQPTAARAVAQACASNPVAVVTPCHRVVRSDGALSGYAWGVDRKRALLDREATE